MNEEFVGQNGKYFAAADSPIGYGRISVILPAVDDSGAEVCIKLFRDRLESLSARHDLLTELRASRTLRHPNILPVLDFGEKSGSGAAFLVMPLCKRGNVEKILSVQSFLPVPAALEILEPIGKAIDHAHKSGIVHGDIKPQNILLADNPDRACLADFGMAKYYLQPGIGAEKPKRRSATTEVLIKTSGGSLSYLSPEQVEKGVQTPRSDIYSFAVVAYELLTGRMPFPENRAFYFQLKAQIEGELVPPGEANPLLPNSAREALLVGLDVKPDCRPESAAEFVARLKGEITGTKRPIARMEKKGEKLDAVFLVHGHAHGTLQAVARFVEHLGLKPVILKEDAGAGNAIIEQIESHSEVSAAIVIMSGDDVGREAKTERKLKRRARQNVVMELGYFIGKLGRDRTIVLREGDLALPSDYRGVIYIDLDEHGAWKLPLAQKLASLGLRLVAIPGLS
jgi:hypothetical protein